MCQCPYKRLPYIFAPFDIKHIDKFGKVIGLIKLFTIHTNELIPDNIIKFQSIKWLDYTQAAESKVR